jgi:DNA-binding YbaB/EbfC family protein
MDGIDFSNLNLGDILNQVQNIAEQIKEEGEKQTFTSSVGGGMVELKVNGNAEVLDLKIDDSLLEDKDSLIVLLISAINEILKQSDEAKKQAALNALGGINPFGNVNR